MINPRCGFLNTNYYFDYLIQFLDHVSDQDFVNKKHREMLFIENKLEDLLAKFKTYQHPDVDKSIWAHNLLKT